MCEYMLTTFIRRRNDGWTQKITAIYSPNHRKKRIAFWKEILEIDQQDSLLSVTGGDFNIVRLLMSRKGVTPTQRIGRTSMTSSMEQA